MFKHVKILIFEIGKEGSLIQASICEFETLEEAEVYIMRSCIHRMRKKNADLKVFK